jgi:hypothetical protein
LRRGRYVLSAAGRSRRRESTKYSLHPGLLLVNPIGGFGAVNRDRRERARQVLQYARESGLLKFPGQLFFRNVLFGVVFPTDILNQSAVFGDCGSSGENQLTGRLLE